MVTKLTVTTVDTHMMVAIMVIAAMDMARDTKSMVEVTIMVMATATVMLMDTKRERSARRLLELVLSRWLARLSALTGRDSVKAARCASLEWSASERVKLLDLKAG